MNFEHLEIQGGIQEAWKFRILGVPGVSGNSRIREGVGNWNI